MPTDLSDLRQELVAAIDGVLARFSVAQPPAELSELTLSAGNQLTEPWSYRWPTNTEIFPDGRWYDVAWDTDDTRVLVAWCLRRAWGRERGRVVVFAQFGPATSNTYYPWVEFVEADDGTYVADIPDPGSPRSRLRAGMDLPAPFHGAHVRRTDECFTSVRNGPTLRLVLDRADEEAMIRHGFWVATLRGRLHG